MQIPDWYASSTCQNAASDQKRLILFVVTYFSKMAVKFCCVDPSYLTQQIWLDHYF